MAYLQYETAKPNVSQTRQGTVDSTRYNLMALRDAVILGAMVGWSMTPGDSTSTAIPTFTAAMADPSQPALIRFRNNPEEIMIWTTWTSGNPTKIRYYYTNDYAAGGYPGTLELMGTENVTYDGDSNVTGTSWE